ncbi:hypothetical protein BC831DRAFT_472492 [Entophlyctis helioformis]|nr:hypothetical protein BC831DRAFT_472492 [Entophlyctis helioformis]
MAHNVLFPTASAQPAAGSSSSQQGGYYAPASQEDLSFQQFSYGDSTGQGYAGGSVGGGAIGSGGSGFSYDANYSGSNASLRVDMSSGVTWQTIRAAFSTGGFADEPPLLEELGINFGHIKAKSLTVMNPLKAVDRHIMDDSDLAGPLIFCFLFGGFLLLSGKAHFGYIYGVAMLGWLAMYTILNLMNDVGIDGYRTASVLGYSLLPMVLLSSTSTLLNLQGWLGFGLSGLTVLWCTTSASAMFVSVLSMTDQRLLVAYPVALLYSAFALLAVF